MQWETYDPAQTRAVGKEFAKGLKAGSVVALDGDLGCGKTAFVQGVTEYFGDAMQVVSPTFTLVNEYEGRVPIYHFDVYRLEDADMDQCDWMDDYLFGDGICLIEWAEYVREILPKDTVWVRFAKNAEKGENYREITLC